MALTIDMVAKDMQTANGNGTPLTRDPAKTIGATIMPPNNEKIDKNIV